MIFSFLHQILMNFLNFKIILIDGMYILDVQSSARLDSILLQ